MTLAAPRVVVMAPEPERSRRRREALGPLLGGDARADAVEALLERRALEWAHAVAAQTGAVVVEAVAQGGSPDVAPADDGPTLLAWPELPLWLVQTGAAALADLAAGCAASVGAMFDGRLYLVAFVEPIPGLLDVLTATPTMGQVLRVAEERKLELGLLRAERGLRGADDVRALLADPLTDGELRGLLG